MSCITIATIARVERFNPQHDRSKWRDDRMRDYTFWYNRFLGEPWTWVDYSPGSLLGCRRRTGRGLEMGRGPGKPAGAQRCPALGRLTCEWGGGQAGPRSPIAALTQKTRPAMPGPARFSYTNPYTNANRPDTMHLKSMAKRVGAFLFWAPCLATATRSGGLLRCSACATPGGNAAAGARSSACPKGSVALGPAMQRKPWRRRAGIEPKGPSA
jgi:hypothetical protein